MKQHLRSIQKALDEHQQAFDEYNQKTSALYLMLGKSVDGLRGPVTGDSFQQGHLGAIVKLGNGLKSAHGVMAKCYAAVQDQMHKSVAAMAAKANVSLLATNANDRSDEGSTTHGAGNDTTGPGTRSEGFKASGMSAADLDRLSKSLPGSTPMTTPLAKHIQARVGRQNPNALGNPMFGKSAGLPVPPGLNKR